MSTIKTVPVNMLTFANKRGRKAISKYDWLDYIPEGEARVFFDGDRKLLTNIKAQVYKRNSLNGVNGKKLSVRQLKNGGFAVIHIEKTISALDS